MHILSHTDHTVYALQYTCYIDGVSSQFIPNNFTFLWLGNNIFLNAATLVDLGPDIHVMIRNKQWESVKLECESECIATMFSKVCIVPEWFSSLSLDERQVGGGGHEVFDDHCL